MDFIRCKHKARKEEMREDALMYYKTASLISRMIGCMFGGKSRQFKIMDEYSWLWSDKERKEAENEEKMRQYNIFVESLMANSINADQAERGNTDG